MGGTRIKACGITNLADAKLAVELGAWALGLIFWPGSPRACAPEEAEVIGADLHRGPAELTGVFVNATLDDLAATADHASLSILQLHGDEGPAYCREAARRTGCKVMKAVRVRAASDVRGLAAYSTDLHLLDAYVPDSPGGTGESFNWELARLHRGPAPVVLSGGLRPDNVERAIEQAQPWGVDSASGTEAEPGRKDPAKLEAFFAAVRAADRRVAEPA
jgi:phosphoribosylanthranilate isomerase